MLYIIQHPILILIFFTVPFFGWILYKSFDDKIIRIVLIISGIVLLPCIAGYSYVLYAVGPLSFYIILSSAYYFLIKKFKNIRNTIIKPTIILFVILGLVSFEGGFLGTITVQHTWKVKGYKIEYLKDQGFSGGPLMKYELYEYAAIPIFIKHVDTKADLDTTNSCIVKFEYKNFKFDPCVINDEDRSNATILYVQ
jgi:hypothetical protein